MRAARGAAAAAVAAIVVVLPASAAGPLSFSDPTGDSTTAPDVAGVAVSNDPAGNVSFAISIPNRTELASDDVVFVFVDSDRSAATGQFGFDYAASLEGPVAELDKWDGTDFRPFTHGAFTASFATGVATITVRRADIGNPKAFDFGLITFKGTDPETAPYDVAPDDDLWTVTLDQAAATLATVDASFTPTVPRAGKRFAVRSVTGKLSDGSTIALKAFSCTATLGGRRAASAGHCAWRIPASAHGRKLVLTVAATYGSGRSSERFVFTAR
jgi:hypothetical protein